MRAIWNGVVSFGLVSVAVRLYAATFNHNIAFHQVHEADGGRIRYRRVCEVCGEEIDYADIAKGYETEDGELVILDSDDIASLPISTSREIEVIEFVPAEQVDPLLMDRSYYLEPDTRAVKPYVLLREALRAADQMAVVKVALRQRETLALLRVRDKAIVLQTMLWPDEVREPDFESLRDDAELRPQELHMASVLISSMSGDFDPTRFDDQYKKAVEELIEYKRQHGGARPAPVAAETGGEPIGDLLTALRRSVEEARTEREVPKPRTSRQPESASQPDESSPATGRGTRKPAGGASARKPANGNPTPKQATPKQATPKQATPKQAPPKRAAAKATRKTASNQATGKVAAKPVPKQAAAAPRSAPKQAAAGRSANKQTGGKAATAKPLAKPLSEPAPAKQPAATRSKRRA